MKVVYHFTFTDDIVVTDDKRIFNGRTKRFLTKAVCGVRTVDQIVQRTEYDKGQVKRILDTQPRFQRTSGGWAAVEQAPATVIEGRTIAEKIHNDLMGNGSSTVTQITRAIGCDNYQAVDDNLRRGRVKAAVRAGIDETSGRRATLWAVEPVRE